MNTYIRIFAFPTIIIVGLIACIPTGYHIISALAFPIGLGYYLPYDLSEGQGSIALFGCYLLYIALYFVSLCISHKLTSSILISVVVFLVILNVNGCYQLEPYGQ